MQVCVFLSVAGYVAVCLWKFTDWWPSAPPLRDR